MSQKWKLIVCVFSLVMAGLIFAVSWGVWTQFKYDKLSWYSISLLPELNVEIITYDDKCAFAILNFGCASTELSVGEGVLMVTPPRESWMLTKGDAYLIHQDLPISSSQLELYHAHPYPLFAQDRIYKGEPLNYPTLKAAEENPHAHYRIDFFKKALIHCRAGEGQPL